MVLLASESFYRINCSLGINPSRLSNHRGLQPQVCSAHPVSATGWKCPLIHSAHLTFSQWTTDGTINPKLSQPRRTFLLQVWFLITWRHAVKGTRVWKVRAQACCLWPPLCLFQLWYPWSCDAAQGFISATPSSWTPSQGAAALVTQSRCHILREAFLAHYC